MKCADVIPYIGPYLDSELDATTTFQIQAHLTRCPRCRMRFDQEHALEIRIAEALAVPSAPDQGRRWERILRRALPGPQAERSSWGALRISSDSAGADWFALAASVVLLAALASAGLGLRHGGQLVFPRATWMTQRFAQLPSRHGDGHARRPGIRDWQGEAGAGQGEGNASQRTSHG